MVVPELPQSITASGFAPSVRSPVPDTMVPTEPVRTFTPSCSHCSRGRLHVVPGREVRQRAPSVRDRREEQGAVRDGLVAGHADGAAQRAHAAERELVGNGHAAHGSTVRLVW